ncbi:MAG: sigma-54-dependent Fis family transcriptional regulator [Alphaproteobacteria bacterium]|nr:MAG: sigma-54-dependent Fis family transcriptional regulator [Alphaproteobacteria bacterium]
MAGPILIVDDEPTQLHLLGAMVERAGHSVETAADGASALARLSDGNRPPVACMILDLQMPGMSGLEVLKSLRPEHPQLPVIVLTAHASVNRVVEVMRAGATDFLVKPASAERIRAAIMSALDHVEMTGELAPLRAAVSTGSGFDDLLGESPAIREAARLARRAAATSIPVLIEGESGVGKEMFARAIHRASARAGGPFVAVNCGAIPENLVESILFGHEKGAFTGAAERHAGRFQEASGGTLFLDEVGELSLDIQVKLLRALQEGEVDPVGARRPVPVDIRLISATNRDMAARVAEGSVREDLYYRLNVFPLHIPPLRERREDVPLLATHFATAIARAEGLAEKVLAPDALSLLQGYDWPGNIRQLQNAIFRAVVMSEGAVITAADFPQILGAPDHKTPAGIDGARSAGAVEEAHPFVSLIDEAGTLRPLSAIEAEVIRKAILRCEGRLSEVARRLGIGRSTLYRRIDELGLGEDARRARHGS